MLWLKLDLEKICHNFILLPRDFYQNQNCSVALGDNLDPTVIFVYL